MTTARAGYTLPVFACAAAIAALRSLKHRHFPKQVRVDLIQSAETATIPIAQVAPLDDTSSLAITHSDPGDNLDLTRHTPIWARVTWADPQQSEQIQIQGGEGIGKIAATGNAAIYAYAQELLITNLAAQLEPDQKIQVAIILPQGRALAERTSNVAFGVVEGLSLLGTSAISQPLSAPEQLETFRQQVRERALTQQTLVFCIGENGLDQAHRLGIPAELCVKTANWLGPLLVEAALQGIRSLLLIGYHGKLIKLAGGIFHTHHHLADARQEILTAYCARFGLTGADLEQVYQSSTVEAALEVLQERDRQYSTQLVPTIFGAIAKDVESRSVAYIHRHYEPTSSPQISSLETMQVGCLLFRRSRQVIAMGSQGQKILKHYQWGL